MTDRRYRPPINPDDFRRPQQARTTCPSCGAAITPEQDTQIREKEQQMQNAIIGRTTVRDRQEGLSPEERAREGLKPFIDFERNREQQQGQFGDRPPPNSPLKYTAVMPPPGMKYVYNQQTGARSTVPIDGGKGFPGQQKPFPKDDLWDRKREDAVGTMYPQWEGPGNPSWEARQKEKEYSRPGIEDSNRYNPLPINDLHERQRQDTGFYQGPSVGEQKKGAIWGAPKKYLNMRPNLNIPDKKKFPGLYDRKRDDTNFAVTR